MACEENKNNNKNARQDTAFDFSTLFFGWIPVLGYPLALYHFLCGRRKRAKFLAVYATVGIVPFAFMVLKGGR